MKTTRTNKVLLTLGSLGVAATIAGAGTWASFTDTETETQSIAAGTVDLGSEAASFATAISNLAAGDTVIRPFQLNNDGSLDLQTIGLVSVASDATGTDAQLFEGSPAASAALQVKIERCSVAWTDGVTDVDTLADDCSGTASVVLAEQKATSGSLRPLSFAGGDIEAGDDNSLLATFRLPQDADNLVQGDAGTLTFTFQATQRDATAG